MIPKECKVLKRAFRRKRVKRTTLVVSPLALIHSIVNPLIVPPTAPVGPPITFPLALVDPLVAPPLAPFSIEGEVAPPITQTPSLLNGDGSPPKEVLMEVENITTSSDEAFVVN